MKTRCSRRTGGCRSDTDALIEVLRDELGHVDLGVSVGVDRDGAAAKLLQAFPCLHLYLVVDPLGQEFCLDPAASGGLFAQPRCTVMRATSIEAGEQFRGGVACRRPLCFALLNDVHGYDDARDSIRAWWHNLKSDDSDGAILAGYYPDERSHNGGVDGVRLAVEEFAGQACQVVHESGRLWWFRKWGGDNLREFIPRDSHTFRQ